MRSEDTIAAIATPPGEGGIAVVRVSGSETRPIAARLFRPMRGGDPAAFAGYTVHYGHFTDAATGDILDDGLLLVFRAPRSYTGEDMIEMSCHGGRVTTARLLRSAFAAGARPAEPGEFTLRAFLNGRLDLAQAEAVADVIRARTETAQRQARRQLEGALSQAVTVLKDELIGILAAIEVTIDFSDEAGELEYEPLEARITAVRQGVERLLATAERGRILREGLRVAIIGRPNVGKSSLLNALLRAERAIVTPIAGTTRDLVEESANVLGLPVVLVDTAGIRDTVDTVERLGVERAENAATQSDVVLLVIDATAGVTSDDIAVARRLSEAESGRLLLVVNKCDAVSSEQASAVMQDTAQAFASASAPILLSAQTGAGLDRLEEALTTAAFTPNLLPNSPSAETAISMPEAEAAFDSVVVAAARHRQALEQAQRNLNEAEQTTAQRLPGDFIAIDVRGALDALGLITGETVTEDILHRIFRDFCVGK